MNYMFFSFKAMNYMFKSDEVCKIATLEDPIFHFIIMPVSYPLFFVFFPLHVSSKTKLKLQVFFFFFPLYALSKTKLKHQVFFFKL